MIARRSLLKRLLGSALVALWGALAPPRAWSSPAPTRERETLAAFVDTLIPADETPAAGELGVTGELIAAAEDSRRLRKLIEKGCAWLDREARRQGASAFGGLAETQREGIARKAEGGDGGLAVALFFDRIRSEAFARYYAHPRIWADLGYTGPPQPAGFMRYTEPLDA